MKPDLELSSALVSLLEKQEHLRAEDRNLERKLRRFQQRRQELRDQEVRIQNEIHAIQIRDERLLSPLLGQPTERSMGMLRTWGVVHQALRSATDPNGMGGGHLRRLVQDSAPCIADATVRSQLHRLKRRGLLVQRGNYWQLGPSASEKDAASTGEQ